MEGSERRETSEDGRGKGGKSVVFKGQKKRGMKESGMRKKSCCQNLQKHLKKGRRDCWN